MTVNSSFLALELAGGITSHAKENANAEKVFRAVLAITVRSVTDVHEVRSEARESYVRGRRAGLGRVRSRSRVGSVGIAIGSDAIVGRGSASAKGRLRVRGGGWQRGGRLEVGRRVWLVCYEGGGRAGEDRDTKQSEEARKRNEETGPYHRRNISTRTHTHTSSICLPTCDVHVRFVPSE